MRTQAGTVYVQVPQHTSVDESLKLCRCACSPWLVPCERSTATCSKRSAANPAIAVRSSRNHYRTHLHKGHLLPRPARPAHASQQHRWPQGRKATREGADRHTTQRPLLVSSPSAAVAPPAVTEPSPCCSWARARLAVSSSPQRLLCLPLCPRRWWPPHLLRVDVHGRVDLSPLLESGKRLTAPLVSGAPVTVWPLAPPSGQGYRREGCRAVRAPGASQPSAGERAVLLAPPLAKALRRAHRQRRWHFVAWV